MTDDTTTLQLQLSADSNLDVLVSLLSHKDDDSKVHFKAVSFLSKADIQMAMQDTTNANSTLRAQVLALQTHLQSVACANRARCTAHVQLVDSDDLFSNQVTTQRSLATEPDALAHSRTFEMTVTQTVFANETNLQKEDPAQGLDTSKTPLFKADEFDLMVNNLTLQVGDGDSEMGKAFEGLDTSSVSVGPKVVLAEFPVVTSDGSPLGKDALNGLDPSSLQDLLRPLDNYDGLSLSAMPLPEAYAPTTSGSTTSTSPLDISSMNNVGANANEGVSSVTLGVIGGLFSVLILAAVVAGLLFFVKRLRQRNVKKFVKIINFASSKRRVHAERLVSKVSSAERRSSANLTRSNEVSRKRSSSADNAQENQMRPSSSEKWDVRILASQRAVV